jgi:hypothetical protein
VHVNTVVSVARLSQILWGDELPADAAATLQNYAFSGSASKVAA